MVQAEAFQQFCKCTPRTVHLDTPLIGQQIDHRDGTFISIINIPAGDHEIICDFHPVTDQVIWTWNDPHNPGAMIIFPDAHVSEN